MKALILSIVVVIIDQASKLMVRANLDYGESHRIVGDFLRLTFIENPGMAFGIQFGGQTFFSVFALLATIVIFVFILRARTAKLYLRLSLTLILGGAIGNLIDRFLYGKVVDFIDVRIGTINWPVFNIADCAVCVGMIMLITIIILDKGPSESQAEDSTKIII